VPPSLSATLLNDVDVSTALPEPNQLLLLVADATSALLSSDAFVSVSLLQLQMQGGHGVVL
jgi:hypothetical protein